MLLCGHYLSCRLAPTLAAVVAVTLALAMACFEISYTVTKASSEQDEHPAKSLTEGGRWAPHPSLGTAWVDLSFGTEFNIHSISFSASGCASIKILLNGRKGERGSWMAGGVTPQNFNMTTRAIEVYDGRLPTAAECRQLLQCRNSGAARLAAVASQELWTGVRLVLTPAPGATPESCFLRRLEVNRQPTKQEQDQIRAEKQGQSAMSSSVSAPAAAALPTRPAPTLLTADALAAHTQQQQQQQQHGPNHHGGTGSSSAAAAPPPPRLAGIAAAKIAAAGGVGPLPAGGQPSSTGHQLPAAAAPAFRPGQRVAGAQAQRRQACECGKVGCTGCGGAGAGKVVCHGHKLLCALKTSKSLSSRGRLFWSCPLLPRPPGSAPALAARPGAVGGSDFSCGFQRWADEAMGLVGKGGQAGDVSLDGFGYDEDPAKASTAKPAAHKPPADLSRVGGTAPSPSASQPAGQPPPHRGPPRPSVLPAGQHTTMPAASPLTQPTVPRTHSVTAAAQQATAAQQAAHSASSPTAEVPDVETLGVKALKELIVSAGLSAEGCIDKDELRNRAREALAALSPGGCTDSHAKLGEAPVETLGVKALKELIVSAGLSAEGCIDKDELRTRAREALAVKAAPKPASNTGAPPVRAAPPPVQKRSRAIDDEDDAFLLAPSPSKKRKKPPAPAPAPAPAAAAAHASVHPATAKGRADAKRAFVDSSTEEEDDDGNGDGADAQGEEACWPAGKPRCRYDHAVGACYQVNPKHLSGFSHSVEHVRKAARVVQFVHAHGPLYRLLHENGVNVSGLGTQKEMLAALDDHLGPPPQAEQERKPRPKPAEQERKPRPKPAEQRQERRRPEKPVGMDVD